MFYYTYPFIATGTGDVAISIAKKLKKQYQTKGINCDMPSVKGLDPSVEMLSYASDKADRHNLTAELQFLHGDATRMPKIPRSSFYLATMSFGIRNIEKRDLAIKEINRIIKKNGKFIVMEFVEPKNSTLAPIAIIFLKYMIPTIGSMFSMGHQNEYSHLSDSIFNFPSPENFKLELENYGFKSCTYKDIFQDIVYIWTCTKN